MVCFTNKPSAPDEKSTFVFVYIDCVSFWTSRNGRRWKTWLLKLTEPLYMRSAKVKASWSAYCGLTSLSSTSNSRSSSSNRSRPRSKGACSISSHGSRCIHWSSSRLCTRSTSSKGRGLGTRGRVDSSGSISRYKSITTINGGSHYRVRSFISRCKGYGTLEVNLVKQGIC